MGVESRESVVLLQAVGNEALLHLNNEVPVEGSIVQTDQDLCYLVPDGVDFDKPVVAVSMPSLRP